MEFTYLKNNIFIVHSQLLLYLALKTVCVIEFRGIENTFLTPAQGRCYDLFSTKVKFVNFKII